MLSGQPWNKDINRLDLFKNNNNAEHFLAAYLLHTLFSFKSHKNMWELVIVKKKQKEIKYSVCESS